MRRSAGLFLFPRLAGCLLGAMYLVGAYSAVAADLEEAIELNGVAVDFNKQAFLWGRRCADQPEKVLQLVASNDPEPPPLALGDIISDREKRLSAYQNAAYARAYTDWVERLREADPHSEQCDSITWLAAENLYKLMAYKDEYEVGRLYSDGEFIRKLEQQFEGDYQLRFNMAPPLFSKRDPNTGHLIKQEFGPWMMKAFGVLSKLRFLRGTALDIFGYSAERRQERADIEEYRELLDTVIAGLTEDNYAVAQELAGLAAKLRGFGHVKDGNREQLAVRKESLLAQLRGESALDAVKFVEAA